MTQPGTETAPAPRSAASPDKPTLVLLDILFCDFESDHEILARYFERFRLTLDSLQQQEVPEGAELLITVQMSADKKEWISRAQEILRTPPKSPRNAIQLWQYEHPAEGYPGGDPDRVDWVKKPNLHSPLREKMFIACHGDLPVERYARVIRVGLDDDDLWMPWQTTNLLMIADAARHDPKVTHDGVLAIGILDTMVGYVGDEGVDVVSSQLRRSLTGDKFHVIDHPTSVADMAAHSPSAVPEQVDVEYHVRFDRRGIGLYAAGGCVPGFIYMRWGQNLSRQGKEYLENEQFGRVHVAAPELVARIPEADVPRSSRELWFSVPGEAPPLKVSARRVGAQVRVNSNYRNLPGRHLKVCYYLMQGSTRVDARWYEEDPRAVFENAPEGVRVRAFVRDADGTIIRAQTGLV